MPTGGITYLSGEQIGQSSFQKTQHISASNLSQKAKAENDETTDVDDIEDPDS